jgi:hypothetical protein
MIWAVLGILVGQRREQAARIFRPRFIDGIYNPAEWNGQAIGGEADAKDIKVREMAGFIDGQIEFARRHLVEQMLNEGIVDRLSEQTLVAQNAAAESFVTAIGSSLFALAVAMVATNADWRSKRAAANWMMCARAVGSTTLGRRACIQGSSNCMAGEAAYNGDG